MQCHLARLNNSMKKIISHNYVNIEMYRKLRHLAGEKNKQKNKTQNQNQQNTMLFFFHESENFLFGLDFFT